MLLTDFSINSVSMTVRSLEELKKKLSDMKSAAKKKERERIVLQKGTGGGVAPKPLSAWDEKVCGIFITIISCC